MTRNIGEPCMCGDPACWVCGDGTPDDAPPPFDATIGLAASLAAAYVAVVAQRDAALRFERQAHAEKNAALARATAAEAAAADLRARVDALTAEVAAGRVLRAAVTVEWSELELGTNPSIGLHNAMWAYDHAVGDSPDGPQGPYVAEGGGVVTLLLPAGPLPHPSPDIMPPLATTATAPATTAATAGEVPHV